MDELFSSKKLGVDPKFISHTSAEILSTTRECFDYCARDVLECVVEPGMHDIEFTNRVRNGKVKVYFPFFKKQLSKDEAFSKLKIINRPFHDHLYSLATKMEENELIPKTNFILGGIIQIAKMVNEKKHSRLVQITSETEQGLVIDSPSVRLMMPIKEQVGWNVIRVSPGMEVMKTKEFRFEYNNEEVAHFCMFATKATAFVLDEIYRSFF